MCGDACAKVCVVMPVMCGDARAVVCVVIRVPKKQPFFAKKHCFL